MKLNTKTLSLLAVLSVSMLACKKEAKEIPQEEISTETLTKIHDHGFGTTSVERTDGGYLVEGDILLTEEFLKGAPGGNF